MILFLDSPATPKGEKGEERVKAKKKEKGLDCSDWKPETSLSPPREKRVEEPKDRYSFWDGRRGLTRNTSSDSAPVCITSFRLRTPGGGYCISLYSAPSGGLLGPARLTHETQIGRPWRGFTLKDAGTGDAACQQGSFSSPRCSSSPRLLTGQWSPTFVGTRGQCHGRQFSHGWWGGRRGEEDAFRMMQARYTYRTL